VTRVRAVTESMIAVQAVELPAAALTLARAFHDDPILALLFGGSVPEPRARRFFEIMGKVQLRHELVFRTPAMEAVSVWAPPGEWKLPNSQIAKNSIGLTRVFGRRLIPNLGILGRIEKEHPREPHYYLEFIGTDPKHQGKGMGTQLMQPMIERCDAEGVGAYLESSKESNVGYYARFGFEITTVLTHKGLKGEPGRNMWLMWRAPR